MKRIKINISDHPFFFGGYLVFLISLIIVLSICSKAESSTLVNNSWSAPQDIFFKYFTYLGDGWSAMLAVLILSAYRLKYGVYALVSFFFTALITQFLKKVIYSEVMRPSIEVFGEVQNIQWHQVEGVELLTSNSFPSGHATSVFSICCLLAILSKRKSVGSLLIIIASITAYSRVYLSQHFLEDIFIGSIIGCLGTLIFVSKMQDLKWGSWSKYSLFKFK